MQQLNQIFFTDKSVCIVAYNWDKLNTMSFEILKWRSVGDFQLLRSWVAVDPWTLLKKFFIFVLDP